MFEFFFVFAMLISFAIALEDIRHGKIPNKLIVLLYALGIFYQVFSATEYMKVVYTFFYALAISFFLWLIGIWPAGDAKLFSVLFLLLPQALYSSTTLTFDFMVNCFVPIFFSMFFVIIAKSRFSVLKDAIKFTLQPYRVTILALALLGFVWFISKGLSFLAFGQAIFSDYFVMLLLLFLTYEVLRRMLSAKVELILFFLAVLRVFLDYRNVYSLTFMLNFGKMIAVFLLFRFFIIYLAFKLYTKSVAIKNLKPGMCPAEMILQKGDEFERISFLNSGLLTFGHEKKGELIHSIDYLSEEDIKRIKKLRKENKIPFNDMLINFTQPFAVFIVLGYALTVLFGTNFVLYITKTVMLSQ
ncbi:MAG: prepilin peptidase [Candidatus Diapherotrites archaeon]|nr:prepilin peptidase [Candidatus Diapherotrites archaeon]